MKYEIYVTLKDGILDKAGNAVARVLNDAYGGVESVRIGKLITLHCNEEDVKNIAKEITNEVMENYVIEEIRSTMVGLQKEIQ